MATVEFLTKRLEGKRTELARLEKKLERIKKAEASNWTNNPYYYSEHDLKYTLRDIEDCKTAITNYETEIKATQQKDASRDVKIILEFLERWKTNVYEIYSNGINEVFDSEDELRLLYRAIPQPTWADSEQKQTYEAARKEHYRNLHGITEKDERSYSVKVKDGKWEWLRSWLKDTREDSLAYLKKFLTEEAKRKYDFIIERTNAIVGQITDASGLSIGAKGDLNGIIIGTEGKARVTTVGAGGYNDDIIVNVKHGQIFHFRTLIKEVK